MTLRRQLPLFLLIGGTSAGIDAGVYTAAVYADTPIALAKALGFVAGAAFGFLANSRVTFAGLHRPGALLRFSLIYGASLQLNVLVNAFVLSVLANVSAGPTAAFLLATTCSATANFLFLKYFAFRPAGTGRAIA